MTSIFQYVKSGQFMLSQQNLAILEQLLKQLSYLDNYYI